MKIGILQTGHAPDPLRAEMGDYADLFQRLLAGHDFTFETWNVVDGQFPPGPDAAEGWLITGSRHGAYEPHDWIPPLEDLIRAIRDAGRPMVGVCFGHQIIAQALGGKVEKFKGGWSVGRTQYMTDEGTTIALNAWHQDQVTELPPGAEVRAWNAFCEAAIVTYGDTIWTVQPHPEFDAAFIDGLIRTRGKGVVPDDELKSAAAHLDTPTANAAVGRRMAEFLKRERG